MEDTRICLPGPGERQLFDSDVRQAGGPVYGGCIMPAGALWYGYPAINDGMGRTSKLLSRHVEL